MMKVLRGSVAKMIFGVLLVAFLAWIIVELGMQGRMGGTAGAAAVVNGEKVLDLEFQVIYRQELEGPMQSQVASMSAEDERQVRHDVLTRLVNQTLIWQQARKLKIAVSDKEVEASVHSIPAFVNPQTGQFDPYRYQAALSRLGVSPQLFELEQARGMSSARVESFMRESVRVTDLELWLEYLRWHRRMRAVVLRFPLAEAKAKQTVTAEEVRTYWDQNRREFEKVERVRIRHIVVAANPAAGPEVAAQAKAKIGQVVEDLRKGVDFADEARRKSDDSGTANRGGDLGWRVQGELIPEYDGVAFKLKTGQVSAVFQTKFGFHVIKCEKHEYAEKPTFEEVKARIRDRILTARAKDQLNSEVTRATWGRKKEKDLRKIAASLGRRASDSGWFEWGKSTPEGLSKKVTEELVKALAGVEVGEMTEPVETDEGWVMAQLVEEAHQRAPEAGFLRDRAVIEPVLLARKQKSAYEAWLDALRAKARITLYLEGGA
jgi:peptidyl-prolyl cis-trans isomerase D